MSNPLTVTIDLGLLMRIAMNDPVCKQEMLLAIAQGEVNHRERLGVCSVPGPDGVGRWHSVFVGTTRDVEIGQPGCLARNPARTHLSLRLKEQLQKKTHEAATKVVTTEDNTALFELLGQQVQQQVAVLAQAAEPSPAEELDEEVVESPFDVELTPAPEPVEEAATISGEFSIDGIDDDDIPGLL